VLAFAVRDLDDAAMAAALADPMAAVTDLTFVALVGIMDPLRTEAKDAVHVALHAGIDVRMITGDHTVTARAIADELGLGPGVITGTELQHLPDTEVIERLPRLHVFGRVAPEDKLRLAKLMQLMVYATIFNINGGVALFPLQLLFCKFFVVITVVIGFIVDVPDPGVMQRPPRKPGTKIVNRPQIIRWIVTGFVLAITALAVLEWVPASPAPRIRRST
jgi:magnesium-transporting ATPase (P-type)